MDRKIVPSLRRQKAIGFLFAMVCLAKPATAGTVTAQNAVGAPGGTAVVTVSVDAFALAGLQLTVNYDAALVLSDADVAGGTLFNLSQITPNTQTAGVAYLAIAGNKDVHGPGSVAVLTFHLPASATPGTVYNIGLQDAQSNDQNGVTTNLSVQNGTITVPGAQAPVAIPQTLSLLHDRSLPITLAATAATGDNLAYSVVSQPTHGMLTGSGSSQTYTPLKGYVGPDSFTFEAEDGAVPSNVATVSLNVTDTPPIAVDQSVTAISGSVLPITLMATDADGDVLSYSETKPAHGLLVFHILTSGKTVFSGYSPSPDYVGPDAFTFKANDGAEDSNVATVSIMVTRTGMGTITVGNATAQPGGIAPVTLSVDSQTTVAAMNVIATYDAAKLTLVDSDISVGALWNGDTFSHNAAQLGQANLVFGNATDVTGPGVLATLNFHVPPSAVNGDTYPVTLVVSSANNAALQAVPLGVVNGTVTVAGIKGDVNADGAVDTKDLTVLLQYLVNTVTLTPAQLHAADVNCDGKVDTKDLTLVLQYLVNIITGFQCND